MKILLIGHKRHGKDTVAELIKHKTGMLYKSSSEMANEKFIYNELKDIYNYSSLEECHKDRENHRSLWYDKICEYNTPDKARLAKDILDKADIYVGMRSLDELEECIKQNLFDYIIGVYDPNKMLEPLSSFTIDIWKYSTMVIPTGNLEEVKVKVGQICKLLNI